MENEPGIRIANATVPLKNCVKPKQFSSAGNRAGIRVGQRNAKPRPARAPSLNPPPKPKQAFSCARNYSVTLPLGSQSQGSNSYFHNLLNLSGNHTSPIVSTNAIDVIGPTPGCVISSFAFFVLFRCF